MNAPKFDRTTPGVSEVVVLVSTLLVEMKQAKSIDEVRFDVLAALHPEKQTQYPVINFCCTHLFQILVGINPEDETYGVCLLGYPIMGIPPFNTIPREAEGLKTLVRALIEKERASWM